MKLASLTAGAFHCCALRDEGSLYVFGHEYGADESNGNLLGLGPRNEEERSFLHRATRVSSLPPVTSVAASTYSTVAIATDGRCYSWGDCDGGALGRSSVNNDAPGLLDAERRRARRRPVLHERRRRVGPGPRLRRAARGGSHQRRGRGFWPACRPFGAAARSATSMGFGVREGGRAAPVFCAQEQNHPAAGARA